MPLRHASLMRVLWIHCWYNPVMICAQALCLATCSMSLGSMDQTGLDLRVHTQCTNI